MVSRQVAAVKSRSGAERGLYKINTGFYVLEVIQAFNGVFFVIISSVNSVERAIHRVVPDQVNLAVIGRFGAGISFASDIIYGRRSSFYYDSAALCIRTTCTADG